MCGGAIFYNGDGECLGWLGSVREQEGEEHGSDNNDDDRENSDHNDDRDDDDHHHHDRHQRSTI